MSKIIVLSIGIFALGMDAYIVSGLLEGMQNSLNVEPEAIGQGVSIFTFFFAISAPICSMVINNKSLKVILTIAMSIFIFGNLLTILTTNFYIYMLSRAIAGIGAGVYSPIAISSAGLLVDKSNRGKALSLILGCMSAGTVIGVPLGLKIADLFSWHYAIGIIILISIASLITLLFKCPDKEITAPASLKERLLLFTHKKIFNITIVTFLAAISSLGLYTYLSLITSQFDIKTKLNTILMVWGIGGLIGSFSIGYVIDYVVNARKVMMMVMTLLTVSIALIPYTIHTSFLLYFPFFLWGLAGWATQTPQQTTLLEAYPEQSSASVALNSSVNYLGSSVGTLIGGFIISVSHNIHVLLLFAALTALLGCTIQAVIYQTNKNTS